MGVKLLEGLIEQMRDLKEISLDLLKLLDITLLLGVSLADLLYLSCLYLQHLVLQFHLLFVVGGVDWAFSPFPLLIDVVVLG